MISSDGREGVISLQRSKQVAVAGARMNCTECRQAIFSLDNYHEQTVFPIEHMLNPFQTYMITQNVLLSLLLIYFWETYEVLVNIICLNRTCPGEWSVSATSCAGYATDNIVADIHQGILGIFLGVYFCTAFAIPTWTLSLRHSVDAGAGALWFKHILFFVAAFLTSLTHGLAPAGSLSYGMLLHWVLLLGVLLVFFFWNKNEVERTLFWTEPGTKRFASTVYNQLYAGWALIVTLLMLCWYIAGAHSVYAVVEPVWLFLIWALTCYGIYMGRGEQLVDVATFGLYSICRRQKKTKFRWNRKRFLRTKQG